MDLIERLMQMAGDRIIIMPGGGSKPEHVSHLKKFLNFQEIHASCKTKVLPSNQFIN